ncbi:DUF4916 domain-containing protein [Streptomyces sp. 2132.2]|uniref:DUF4916 domain-containing protein n=1 Tax=Streptomyces sp. 2132.2 TaxID=2485161 RepID=UPI0037D9DEF4
MPCARAVRLGPQPRPPFSVAEYCPAVSVTTYQDPRRHAVSLAYVVPVAGDCCSWQNALELVWSSPQEVFSPAVQSEMPGGHECCRSTAPRTRRARPFTRRRRPSAPSSGRVGETGTRARAGRGAMALSSPRRAVGGAWPVVRIRCARSGPTRCPSTSPRPSTPRGILCPARSR